MRNSQSTVLFLLVCVLCSGAYADLGPKPTASFTFQTPPGDDFRCTTGGYADDSYVCEFIQCDEKSCTEGEPLGKNGPQRFGCSSTGCGALAYGFSPYGKLRLQFGDTVLESNVFAIGVFATTNASRFPGQSSRYLSCAPSTT